MVPAPLKLLPALSVHVPPSLTVALPSLLIAPLLVPVTFRSSVPVWPSMVEELVRVTLLSVLVPVPPDFCSVPPLLLNVP